jgi:hypothetical protein
LFVLLRATYIVGVVDMVGGDNFVNYGQIPFAKALRKKTGKDGLVFF